LSTRSKSESWDLPARTADGDGSAGQQEHGSNRAQAWKIETFSPTDPFDPKTNLDVGTWYFKKKLVRWKLKGDAIPFALAEYNAGHARMERWISMTGRGEEATPSDLLKAIDFPSTRKSVEDITARYHFYQSNPPF